MATLTMDARSLIGAIGAVEAHAEVMPAEERTNWSERKVLRIQWMADTDSHCRIIMRPHWVEEVE